MSHRPAVSVIVPTFNRPAMLAEALESLDAQILRDFEVVVVNDAGSDVADVVARFPGLRLQVITHERNQGLSAARNTGLQSARGEMIAFLDDDDRLYPDHLAVLVAALEAHLGAALAYSDAYQAVQVQDGDHWVIARRFLCHSVPYRPLRLLIDNHLAVQCVLARRAVFDAVGGFDVALSVYEDWDLWLRASKRFRFVHVPAVTSEYRVRQSPDRISVRHQERFLRTRFALWRRHGWLPAVILAACAHFSGRLVLRALGRHRPAPSTP